MTMDATIKNAVNNFKNAFASFNADASFNSIQYDSEGRHFTGLNEQLLSVEAQRHQYTSSRWLSEAEIGREGITIPESAEPAELVMFTNSGIDENGETFVYNSPVMTTQKYYNLSALEIPVDSRFAALREVRIHDISNKEDLLSLLSPNPDQDQELIDAVSANDHNFCLRRIRDIAENPSSQLPPEAQEYFTWQICTDFGIRYQPRTSLQFSGKILEVAGKLRRSLYSRAGIDLNRQLKKLTAPRRSLNEVISSTAASRPASEVSNAIQNRIAEKTSYQPQAAAERQNASMQESSRDVQNRTDGKSEIEKGTIHNRNLNGRPDHQPDIAITAAVSYIPEQRNISIQFSGIPADECRNSMRALGFEYNRQGRIWYLNGKGSQEDLQEDLNRALEMVKSYGYEIKSQNGPEIQSGISAVRTGSDSQEHPADAGGHGVHEAAPDVVSGNEKLGTEPELSRGSSANLADPEVPSSGNEADDRHNDSGLRNAGTEGPEPSSRTVLQEGISSELRESDARRPSADSADGAPGTEGSPASDVHAAAGQGSDDDHDQTAAGVPGTGPVGGEQEKPLQDDLSRPASSELGMDAGGLGDVPLHQQQDSRASGSDQAGSAAAETESREGGEGRPGIPLGASAALLDEQNVRNGNSGESAVSERGGRGSDGDRDDENPVQNQPAGTADTILDPAGTGQENIRNKNQEEPETGTDRSVVGEGENRGAFKISRDDSGRHDIPGSDSRGGEPVREDTAEVSEVSDRSSNVSVGKHDDGTSDEELRSVQRESDVPHPDQDEPAVGTGNGPDVNLNRHNYTIEEDLLRGSSSTEQLIANLDALELALKLQKEGRQASSKEKDTLARFTGFGSLHPEQLRGNLKERYEAVLNQIYGGDQVSLLLETNQTHENAFFTPHAIVNLIYDTLTLNGFKGGNVLEPSCGSGNFIGSVPEELKEHTRFTGVEIDPAAALIAKYLYPDAEIVNTGIQNTVKKDFYDVAIGNVPFSDGDQGFENTDEIKDFLHFDRNKNITLPQLVLGKAVQETRQGGIVAMIVPTGLMDNPSNREFRLQLSKQAEFIGAARIPQGGFARTQTDADLVFLKRRDHEVEFDPQTYHDQAWVETVQLGSCFKGIELNSDGRVNEQQFALNDWITTSRTFFAKDDAENSRPIKVCATGSLLVTPLDIVKQNINSYYAQNLSDHFPHQQVDFVISKSNRWGNAQNTTFRLATRNNVSVIDNLIYQAASQIHFDYKAQTKEQQEKSIAADAAITAAAKTSAEHPANRVYVENGEARIRTTSGQVQSIKTNKEEQIEIISGLCDLRDTTSKLYRLQQDRDNDDPEIISLRQHLNSVYDNLSDKYDKPKTITDKDGNKLEVRKGIILPNINFFRQKGGEDAHAADSLAEMLCGLEKTDFVTVKKGEKETKIPILGGTNQIFRENTVAIKAEPRSAATDEEALLISKNMRGKLDFSYIAKLRKSTPEEIVKSYLEKKLIYRDPETYDPAKPLEGFVSRDDYLYGDLYLKIKTAKEHHFDDNVRDLEAVMPPKIKAADIAVQIGQSWIPEKYYAQFLQQVVEKVAYKNDELDFDNTDYASRITKIGELYAVKPLPYAATRVHGFSANDYARFYPEKNKDPAEPYEIFENLLNGLKQPINEKQDKKQIEEDTVRMANSVQTMQNAFKQWIFADPERAADLEKIYNEKFNSIRPKDYSAENESMIFHGMAADKTMRAHQKKAISRILHGDCNQLLAHCTGAGKTYEMLAAAVEAQKLGLANKQILVFPKQVVGQASQSLQELYPGLEGVVVHPASGSLNKNDRQAFLARCLDPDVHFIIMTQEQFKAIPSDPEWQQEMNQREQARILALFNEFEKQGIEGRAKKKLSDQLKALKRQQDSIAQKIAKHADDGITFQQLGIDRLFVDEAHNFKNLKVTSGKSTALSIAGSTRASDMLLKCTYLNEHKKHPSVIFSTATPISNSVVELYNMVRYLTPEKLEARGIHSVDAFANNYLSDKMGWETKVDGSFAPVITPDKWQNPDDLMKIIKDSWDILTETDLRRLGEVKLPASHTNIIEIPKSETQTRLMEKIFERGTKIRDGDVPPRVDNMLKISHDSKMLSLDERLPVAQYLFEKRQLQLQKENLAFANSNLAPEDSMIDLNGALANPGMFFTGHRNGAVKVFTDSNKTPLAYRGFEVSLKKDVQAIPPADDEEDTKYAEAYSAILHNPAHGEDRAGDIIVQISGLGTKQESVFETADIKLDRALASLGKEIEEHETGFKLRYAAEIEMEQAGILEKDFGRSSSKVSTCCDVITKTYHDNQDPDGKGTQVVFLDSSVNENINGFSLYNELKKELIARGIPENEIAVADDYKNAPGRTDDEKKSNFFDKVNSGEIRVIIGSTQKIGTGVNMQGHIVAMHHLDVPWRPADLEQRNGRGIRQGNKNSDVQNYFYVTKGTFDELVWQKVLKKQTAIQGLMQADGSGIRQKELSTGDADNGGNMSLEDLNKLADISAANPKQNELRKSEDALHELDILAGDFIDKKNNSRQILQKYDSTVQELRQKIQKRQNEQKLRDSAPQSLTLLNMPDTPEITEAEEINKALLSLKKEDLSVFQKIDELSDGTEHEITYRIGSYRGFNLNLIVSDGRKLEKNENGGFSFSLQDSAGSGENAKTYELQLQNPNDELRTFETSLRDSKKSLDKLLSLNIDENIAAFKNQLDTEELKHKAAEDFVTKSWEDSDKYLKELKNNISLTFEVSGQMTKSDDISAAKSSIATRIAKYIYVSGKTEAEAFDLLNENGYLEKLGFEKPESREAEKHHNEPQDSRTEATAEEPQQQASADDPVAPEAEFKAFVEALNEQESKTEQEQRDSGSEADVRADTSSADEPVSLESLFNTVVETTNELNQHKTEWEQQSPGAKSIFDYLDSQFQFPIVMGIPDDQRKQVLEQLADFAYKWKVSPNAMKDILSDELDYRENKVEKNWPDPIDLHRKKLQFLSNYNVYAHSGSTPIFNNGSAFHKAEEDAFDSLLHNQLRPLLGIKENEQVKESVQPEVESNSESIAEQLDDAVNEARKQPGNEVSKEDEHLARLQQQLSAGQSKQSEGEESPNTVSEEPHQESAAPATSEAPEKPREQSGRWAEKVTSFAGMEVHVISPDADDADRIAAKFNELDNEYFAKRNAKLGINENQAEDEQQTNAVNESGREAAPEADTGLAPAKQEPQSVEKSAADQQSAAIDDAFSTPDIQQTDSQEKENSEPDHESQSAAIDDAFSSLNMLQTETGSSEKDSPVTVEKKAAQGPEAAVNQPAEVRPDEEPKAKESDTAAEQYDEKVLLITQKIISDPFSQHKYPRIEAFHDGNLLRKAAFNLAGFAVKWGIEPENMKAILDKELSGYQLSHQPEITLDQLRLLGNLDTEDKKRFEEFKKDHPGKFTEKSGYLHYRRERSREFKVMMDEHIRPILGITVEGILNQAEAYTGSRLVPSSSARDCENTHVKAALKTSGNKFIATNELVLSIAVAMNSTARSMTVKSFFSQFEKATDIADDLLRKDAIALDFEEANGKRLSVRCFPVSDIDFAKLHEKYPQLETALEFLKPENGQYWLQNHPARSEEIKLYFQKHLQDVYAPSTKGFYTLTPGAARIHNFSQISEICEHSYKKEMEEIFNHYGVYPRFISRAHVSSEVDSFGKVVDDASSKVIVEGKNAVDKKNIKQVPDSQPKEGGKSGLCLS